MVDYVDKGASISACGTYRYRLWREWRGGAGEQWDMWTEDDGSPCLDGDGEHLGEPLSCVFVMLNPSTADGSEDDPTIRRCVSFATALGFDRLEVVNLFAFRATDPQELLSVGPERDPVGFDNSRHIHEVLDRAGLIICAWGAHGGYLGQDETTLGWIENGNDREAEVVALGLTKDGHPRHPLYLPRSATPMPFNGRAS